MRRLCPLLVLFALAGPSAASAEAWRLGEAAKLPESLSLEVTHRWRFEYLDDQFRAGRSGHDRAVMVQTLAHARWQPFAFFGVGAELLDSRAWPGERSTLLDTGIVNPAELLRAYVELSHDLAGGALRVQSGRMTLDVGDRRLVARHRFRNTLTAYTGVDLEWSNEAGASLRGFYTLPVQRRPTGQRDLRDNEPKFDQETLDLQFWGLYGNHPLPALGLDVAELFFYGLHERDRKSRPSRDRELFTTGFRAKRDPEAGAFDFELESVLQFGESRLSNAATTDLDHLAHYHHAELGYRFDAPCAPRLVLQYDYASGDRDPSDGQNNRFDPLFGSRRFDFGPTSLYGPFARSNLNSPGLRFHAKPLAWIGLMVAYRAYWLASNDDAWTASGAVDPSGDTNPFLGTQLEARLRVDLLPGNLRLEAGVAHLFRGDFARKAPNANGQGDPTFSYVQATLSF